MNRQQVWKVVSVAFLVFELTLCWQQSTSGAAAPNTVPGREAFTALDPGNTGRQARGTFTTFDVPGAGTGYGEGTIPSGINSAGAITGSYFDSKDVGHGFLGSKDGTFTTFDAPVPAQPPAKGP
jgi:hypothetical protein